MLRLTIIFSFGLLALVNCECGRPAIPPNTSKIVGGTDATPFSWPWQGALMKKTKNGWFGRWTFKYYGHMFLCGGTLIAPNWFMTAAHCVHADHKGADYKVMLGLYDKEEPEESAQTVGVKAVHEYNKYEYDTQAFDIALIELETPAQITDQVSTVCLPVNDTAQLTQGHNVTVTGWGSTYAGGSVVPTLRQVSVAFVPYETCNGYSEYDGRVNEECMFCAGLGGRDSCQGDSGGPAVAQQNGQWFQFGIVSWGYGCADARHPGVYSRVADYCQFITETTGLNLCQ